MKSINRIFSSNVEVMNIPEVKELIEYCTDLEEEILDLRISSTKNKELILLDIIRDVYSSCSSALVADEEALRFTEAEQINFKQAIINLKKYLLICSKDNNFNL